MTRRALPYAVFALALALVWPLLSPPLMLGDHLTFWYAGHLVATGASPYDVAAWEPVAREYGRLPDGAAVNVLDGLDQDRLARMWLYPPWTALALAPFGALPLAAGVTAWHVALLVAGVAAAIAAARAFGPRGGPGLALALAAFAFSQPFVIATRSGHLDAVLLLGTSLFAIAIASSRLWAGTAGGILLALKPHITVPLALVALWRICRRRGRRPVGAAAAAVVAFVGLGLLLVPIDLSAYGARLAAKAGDDVASTWHLGAELVPGVPAVGAVALIAVALGAAAIANANRVARDGTAMEIALALALWLVAAPYAQTYDHVLLVPLVFLTFGALRGPVALSAFALAVVAVPWLLATAVDAARGSQASSAVVPLLALVAAAAALRRDRARQPAAEPVVVSAAQSEVRNAR